jgi:signal transduction histidine kinase
MASSYRILITDDNSAIHEDIASILNHHFSKNKELSALDRELFGGDDAELQHEKQQIIQYRIDHAYSGEEAIEKVAKAHAENDPYALIFMDVRMPPGIDGIVAVQKIWEQYPNIEIVICSAYSDYNWENIIKIFGKTDKLMFLQKPFNRIAIQQMALSMVTKWEVQNELRELVDTLDAKVEKRTRELKIALEQMKKAQKEREKAAAAAAAQKARSEFLSIMGHELRTPLNAILGFADLLKPHVPSGKPAEYLSSIKTSGKALIGMVNDILDISKMEAGKIGIQHEPTDIKTLIEEISAMHRLAARQKNLSFTVEVADSLPNVVIVDPRRLRQIVNSLVDNAIKFTEKGHVKVEVNAMPGEQHGQVDLQISVSDTGIGITPKQLQRIFELFTQENSADNRHFEGLGLGLTISRRLAAAMGGELQVHSSVGEGSTFTLRLPNIEVGDVVHVIQQQSVESATAPTDRESELWGDKFVPERATHAEIKRLTRVLEKLENQIMKKWESIFDTMITSDIQRFGEAIQKIGSEFEIVPLQRWGQQVAEHAENFQIVEMSHIMAQYPQLVKQFSEVVRKHEKQHP